MANEINKCVLEEKKTKQPYACFLKANLQDCSAQEHNITP
jgi:hypothetical protein